MHVEIRSTRNLHRAVLYHVRKQQKGVAEFLAARNFMKEVDVLRPREIEYELGRLHAQNERARQTTMHILMKFHEGAVVGNEQMVRVADDYMRRMGLEEQPYLTIRHNDSEMTHLHIVSSYVREGGELVDWGRRDYYKSVAVVKELERAYGLEPPRAGEDVWRRTSLRERVATEGGMKRQFNEVLGRVVDGYQYGSIEELNAVLRGYRMEAVRTETRDRRGVYYVPLDESGKKDQRLYINAHQLEGRPTLWRLEKRFVESEQHAERDRYEKRVRGEVNYVLERQRVDVEGLGARLRKEGIDLVAYRDEAGDLKDVFYVDHKGHFALRGERLGEDYGVAGLERRTLSAEEMRQEEALQEALREKQVLHQQQKLRVW